MKIKESKKRDKYLDLVNVLRKLWKIRMTVIPIVIGALGIFPQRTGKRPGRVINRRTNGNHLNYRLFKFGQNTEKSLGDLRSLAVIQTPVEDHQLRLV